MNKELFFTVAILLVSLALFFISLPKSRNCLDAEASRTADTWRVIQLISAMLAGIMYIVVMVLIMFTEVM